MRHHYDLSMALGLDHNRHEQTYNSLVVQVLFRLIEYDWVSFPINEEIENQKQCTTLARGKLFNWRLLEQKRVDWLDVGQPKKKVVERPRFLVFP